jgi:hypothetical protein
MRTLLAGIGRRIAYANYRRKTRFTSITLDEVLAGNSDLCLDLSCWDKDLRAGGFIDTIVFASLVRARAPKCYFEIGTGFGRSAMLAALNTPADAVINTMCIDYEDNPRIGWIFRTHALKPKINAMKGDSKTFSFDPWLGKVEFVFIDGAHDFDHVSHDSSVAFRLVAPGGWILWHDLSMECPGVAEALRSSERAGEICQIAGTAYGCFRDNHPRG